MNRKLTIHSWIFVLLLASAPLNGLAQFTERSQEVGIDHQFRAFIYIGGGVALFDINNDLMLDMFLTGGIAQDRLYINNGSTFTRKVIYTGPEDFELLEGRTVGVAAGDVDNDGYDDLFLCTENEFPSLLMINNGDETFDVLSPAESGITESEWCVSAVFGDVNKDGFLDIYATNYVDSTHSYWDPETSTTIFQHKGFNNYLYINQGDNTFVEMADSYGVQKEGTSLSAVFTDYDNDRDADIYVINDFGHFVIPNELYQNQYPAPLFEDRSEISGADIGLFGMGIAVGDYDLDLDLDYYVTNIGRNALLRNNGDGTFTDATYAARVQDSVDLELSRRTGWGTAFIDYDNNGLLDLYISNGYIPAANDIINGLYNDNSLYHNNGDGTFSEIADSLGLADPAPDRGTAYGDLDSDGDLDLVFVPISISPPITPPNVSDKVTVYYNELENDNNWIQVKLEGDSSNRSGYGAHLFIYSDGYALMREANPGAHASSNSPFIHFGLSTFDRLDSLVILWPSGIRQTVYDPAVNMLHVIREGEDIGTPVGLKENVLDQISLYPNPAADLLWADASALKAGQIPFEFEIRNTGGSLVTSGMVHAGPTAIDLKGIPPGSYEFCLIHNGRMLGARSFIKQ